MTLFPLKDVCVCVCGGGGGGRGGVLTSVSVPVISGEARPSYRVSLNLIKFPKLNENRQKCHFY